MQWNILFFIALSAADEARKGRNLLPYAADCHEMPPYREAFPWRRTSPNPSSRCFEPTVFGHLIAKDIHQQQLLTGAQGQRPLAESNTGRGSRSAENEDNGWCGNEADKDCCQPAEKQHSCGGSLPTRTGSTATETANRGKTRNCTPVAQ